MPNFPGFIRGRDLLYCYIGGFTVSTTGTANQVFTIPDLTADMNLSGYVDYVKLGSNPNNELIQSIDMTVANYLNVYDDFTLSLGEIQRISGVGSAPPPVQTVLLSAVAQYDNVFCQYAIRSINDPYGSAPSTPLVFTLIGTRGDWNGGIPAWGKNSNDLVIRPTTWADMPGNPLTVGNVTGITSPIWISGGADDYNS